MLGIRDAASIQLGLPSRDILIPTPVSNRRSWRRNVLIECGTTVGLQQLVIIGLEELFDSVIWTKQHQCIGGFVTATLRSPAAWTLFQVKGRRFDAHVVLFGWQSPQPSTRRVFYMLNYTPFHIDKT